MTAKLLAGGSESPGAYATSTTPGEKTRSFSVPGCIFDVTPSEWTGHDRDSKD